MLRLLRVPRHVNLRLAAIRREKRRENLSFIDVTILARETHLAITSPERMTHRQKLFRARVSLIVVQKISIPALLYRRAARDDVQTHASINQTRQRVDLLDEGRRGRPELQKCQYERDARQLMDSQAQLMDSQAQPSEPQFLVGPATGHVRDDVAITNA